MNLEIVPCGESCDIDEVSKDCRFVIFKKQLYHRVGDSYWWEALDDASLPKHLQSYSFVQPVKLELVEARNHDP